MKKSIYTVFICAAFASQAMAWWGSGTKESPSQFSATQTDGNTIDMELYSNKPTADGENYFNVDKDITLKSLKSVWLSSNQVMTMAKSDGTFASITLDVAKYTTSDPVQVIALRGTETYGQNSLDIQNGTINILNSGSDYTPSAMFRVLENSTGANKKILTFGEDSTINSQLNIFLEGANNATYKDRSVINFNGALNTATTVSTVTTYKELTLNGSSSNSIIANFGAKSVSNIGKLLVNQYSVINIDGQMNVNTKNVSYAADTHNVFVDKFAVMNISGSLKISSNGSMHALGVYGKVNVLETGSIYANDGGYRNLQLYSGGVVDVSSTAKNSFTFGDGVRLNGGTLILRSKEAATDLIVWVYNATSNMTIDNQVDLGGFTFVKKGILNLTFTDDGQLWLKDFSVTKGGSWADYLDSTSTLNLIDFENYKLHVENYRAEDDLSRIFADGFEEGSFRWEADNVNGGYWLIGTAVSEPATVAALFGALALALAVWRKRN